MIGNFDTAQWNLAAVPLVDVLSSGGRGFSSASEGGIGAVALRFKGLFMSSLPETIPHTTAPAFLRVFDPSEIAPTSESVDSTPPLSASMTVLEFVSAWYIPVVSRGKDSAEGTESMIWEAVQWWERLTANPPLRDLIADQRITAKFLEHLRVATYRRSPKGREYPLKPGTQAKVIRTLRAIFYRLGPTVDDRKPTAELLSRRPYLSLEASAAAGISPKRPFTIPVARRLLEACKLMTWGRRRGKTMRPTYPCHLWWEAFLVGLYYVGVRAGTQMAIRMSMIERLAPGRGAILNLPGSAVTKTRKPTLKYLHPIALAAIDRLHAALPEPSEFAYPWNYGYEHFSDKHEELQQLAGIAIDDMLSPQAWRRTHGTQMAKVGAKRSLEVAKRALDHSDGETTKRYYVNVDGYLIRRLPKIFDLPVSAPVDPRQRTLF